MGTQVVNWREEGASVRYVAPFALFILFLALGKQAHLDSTWGAPLRVLILGTVCALCWPSKLSIRPVQPLLSVLVGGATFLLWIAPDVLIPGYRENVLFSNAVIGHVHSSLDTSALRDPWLLAWRTARAVIVVPVVEELFWRGWLMRWLINTEFEKVSLGTYSPFAFWMTAVLFASEHGPYWDVGLLTGIIYNLWMIRTKSVASCILMHAVTNAALSAYVIYAAQWQYWQ